MSKILKRLYRRLFKQKKEKEFFQEKDYLQAYSQHTDQRIEHNPQTAIGGNWEEIGELQYNFLKQQGLKPENTMLDIGCGTLRGGRHFIKYLNAGNYHGIDISKKAIEICELFVKDEGMSDKQPQLIHNAKMNLKFEDFNGQTFDFLLAQSVFTHLLEEHIRECFAHVGKVMNQNSRFYFTFKEGPFSKITDKDFSQPVSFFEDLAKERGFKFVNCSDSYPHPRSQRIARISKI